MKHKYTKKELEVCRELNFKARRRWNPGEVENHLNFIMDYDIALYDSSIIPWTICEASDYDKIRSTLLIQLLVGDL